MEEIQTRQAILDAEKQINEETKRNIDAFFAYQRSQFYQFSGEQKKLVIEKEIETLNARLAVEKEGSAAYYEILTQREDKRKELQEQAAKGSISLSDAWNNTVKQMAESTTLSFDTAFQTMLSGFEKVGEALVNGEDGFKAFAKAGIESIASMIQALATHIQGQAFVALGEKDYSAFGKLTAASASIRVAAGVVKALAGKFASGGIVSGNSYRGDNMLASVNSGELILNEGQQGNLAKTLANANALLSKLFSPNNAESAGVNINIINNSNAEVSAKENEGNEGRIIDILIENKINSFMTSPKGSNLMNATYGISKQGIRNR